MSCHTIGTMFAKKNKQNAEDVVQIWFFRSRERKPCFGVVNLGQEPASCSSLADGEGESEPMSDVTAQLLTKNLQWLVSFLVFIQAKQNFCTVVPN
ncbi:hypothetical protein TIFTF001_025302 [Ficus carica]|uniref:Uncharacterized protein n=1 Tax=Ficus carica TaxID=3494 RepID=A0AA88DFF9_FICCA|nr:hypothetical protein TIFTF001_025302 [Ficus carica]